MRVKMILPALTEARSPHWRPIKYSLFPPLGLATLAAYLGSDDEVSIADEHVGEPDLDDEPDLVVIEAYVTSARRAYELADMHRARGAHVCLGGLHPTALPDEAAEHADTVFIGPGEDTWPRFLEDLRAGCPLPRYRSVRRCLDGMPPPRRDLIQRERYLVPNSLVVSRGCPHSCDFCYKPSFFAGGRSFYTQPVDEALAEIGRLPGRHLFFLDDNLFGRPRFARALFDGMRGMGRVWQAAGTVRACLDTDLLDRAVGCGLGSLFVGFETLSAGGLRAQNKLHNLHRDYDRAIAELKDRGVMINGSFVFGLDEDDPDVFERTVDWAVERGIETATFHVLTPYPGTRLHARLDREGRILTSDWNLYDTRHCVFRPARMTPTELVRGYHGAYDRFYSWRSIARAVLTEKSPTRALRHLAYTAGWKKLEPVWARIIDRGLLGRARPLLETLLDRRGSRPRGAPASPPSPRPLPRTEPAPLSTARWCRTDDRSLLIADAAQVECAAPQLVDAGVGGSLVEGRVG